MFNKQRCSFLKLGGTFLLACLIALGGCTAASKKIGSSEQPSEQKNQQTVEKTSRDNWPKGCTDCHKKTKERDVSLQAEVKKIKNHPPTTATTVRECYTCHSLDEKRLRAFSNGLHKAHLKGDSIFVKKYNGTCIACHKFEPDTGNIVVKGLEAVEKEKQSS